MKTRVQPLRQLNSYILSPARNNKPTSGSLGNQVRTCSPAPGRIPLGKAGGVLLTIAAFFGSGLFLHVLVSDTSIWDPNMFGGNLFNTRSCGFIKGLDPHPHTPAGSIAQALRLLHSD